MAGPGPLLIGDRNTVHRERSAVICDMDGLLVDSEPLYQRAWQAAAASLGFELTDTRYEPFVGRGESESETLLMSMFGESFPLTEFRRAWKKGWRGRVEAGELSAKPGAEDLLDAIRRTGVPLALATSSTGYYAELSLRRTGLDPFFDHVVTADEVTRAKPAPDLFIEAASQLGVRPDQCLVLEDSAAGAEAGFAAGMAVVIVPDLHTPPAHCAERADAVFTNLSDAIPHVLAALRAQRRKSPDE